MNDGIDIESLAEEIKHAQDRCVSVAPLTLRHEGFAHAEAYAVARRVHEMRTREGARPVGRKIGFTNPDMWAIYGVHEPIWGFVYDKSVEAAGEKVVCRLGSFAEPKIEPEIVVHFGAAPPPGAGPNEILGCVDWIAHGIEVVQSHFPGWKFQAPDTVADGGLHGRLLVGAAREVGRLGEGVAADLENFVVELFCDGRLQEEGRGANVLGSPLKAVAHLVGVLAGQPESPPLQAGELVTTGTLTTALPIAPGQTWHTALTGIDLPGITVSFEA